ncbi:unnamed protein product [Closterium sp. NIES-54]
MQLQEVVTETNLEMQGIKDVRWLSRGDAIARLADVFPAVVLLLYEYDKKTYNIVTSFKFQFLLYFLADVLKELNYLNLKFQRRKHTLNTLSSRYIDYKDAFGDNSGRLAVFLQAHQSRQQRSVKVEGVDSDGTPTTHAYELHEKHLKGQTSGSDLRACINLASEFAKEAVFNLTDRMKDLSSLKGSRLFRQSAYPSMRTMLAVLPLSTVECERGFNRQNVIKSWMRSNLCDATLGELMTVSLLDYEMEPHAIMSVWHGSKKRRPAKEVVMAQAGRAEKRAKRATSSTQASAAAASKAAVAAAARAAHDAEAEAAREREEVAVEEARILVWKRKSKGRVEEEEQVSEDEDNDDCSVSSSESDDDTE